MKIWVNKAVCDDFTWAMEHLCDSLGIRLLSSISWTIEDVDETIFCDACQTGLAFWFPACFQGYYSPVPLDTASDIIFYFETLAIAGAFENLCTSAMHLSKIVIYTNNMNMVNIFNMM